MIFWPKSSHSDLLRGQSRSCKILRLSLFFLITSFLSCSSKEVEVTKEWYLLKENETVPAGVHVKMDLSTGQKWVKLVEEKNDESTDVMQSVLEADGSLSIIPNQNKQEAEENIERKESVEKRSHEFLDDETITIHRTLSQLPDSEKERIEGGLPELPFAPDNSISKNWTKEEYEIFQERMKEIWKQRQEDLAKLEDILADFPKILRDRISSIKSYILNGYLLDEREESTSSDLIFILRDLEEQLSDIDMARDFHFMGGWDLLASLLLQDAHDSAISLFQTKQNTTHVFPLEQIQTTAAWVMGTAVKNNNDFHTWITQSIALASGESKNVLELVLANLHSCSADACPLDKYIYALGAFLRGNEMAQKEAQQLNFSPILFSAAQSSMELLEWKSLLKILLLIKELEHVEVNNKNEWCELMTKSMQKYSDTIHCTVRKPVWQEKMLLAYEFCSNGGAAEEILKGWIICWLDDVSMDSEWRMELIDSVSLIIRK